MAPATGRGRRGRKRYVFKYTKEEWMGKTYARPKVEATLRNGELEFRTLMLIDSGADVSFVPAVVAEILDLELSEETRRSKGVSGWFDTRDANCDVCLYSKGAVLELLRIPVLVPVEDRAEEEGSAVDYCLLGRTPMFNRFNVHFKQRKRLIIATRSRSG